MTANQEIEQNSQKPISTEAYVLVNALNYLEKIIRLRLAKQFGKEYEYDQIKDIPLPNFNGQATAFTDFVSKAALSLDEFILLLIALSPHIQPHFFDQFMNEYLPQDGDFPQLGGVRGKQHRGFLPTGETFLFLIAASNIEKRFTAQHLFHEGHFFSKQRIVYLEAPQSGEPLMSGKLTLAQDYVDLFIFGHIFPPKFSTSFPAQRIETELEWEDLILNSHTQSQIQELKTWMIHGETLLYSWGMKKKIKLGYRALFHGPPGTGKTFAASLIGKYTQRDVFKVDLSMIVSKFIGETEKNLANLFARAENKGWILFFDEADAIFGKRTNVRDAHDKYANQEVSYLLQRIENYDGLVILASNFKNNIDEAFTRRFQSIIHFPMPQAAERLKIWQASFPKEITLDKGVNFNSIAREYELSGAEVLNVVQSCCLGALAKDSLLIKARDIQEGIRKEFQKRGKIIR